jgi:hypothetical protein
VNGWRLAEPCQRRATAYQPPDCPGSRTHRSVEGALPNLLRVAVSRRSCSARLVLSSTTLPFFGTGAPRPSRATTNGRLDPGRLPKAEGPLPRGIARSSATAARGILISNREAPCKNVGSRHRPWFGGRFPQGPQVPLHESSLHACHQLGRARGKERHPAKARAGSSLT